LKLTEKEVRYVADLANLDLSEGEISRMTRDLDSILAHMDKLNELDVRQVAPMAQVLYGAEECATLRPDVEAPTLGSATATANSALHGGGFFKVPKVIDR
jgi:aspartyl-tRNA(Asn)/glutamyl-tRNA(Gln) amidotransferase subunit C